MRISWLTPDEIADARAALTAGGATWASHFHPDFVAPPEPAGDRMLEWAHLTEHVARAERVSEVVREHGIEAARLRFGRSLAAIEIATLAAAEHENGSLDLDGVIRVLATPIDSYVFYAPFLELLAEYGRGQPDRTVPAYEAFADAYAKALARTMHGGPRISAVRDGLADYYVSVGRMAEAQQLFEVRHDEDQGDVAVALTASRAYLAAGAVDQAVHWLGVGAARATALGRTDLATKLREKQQRVRERLERVTN